MSAYLSRLVQRFSPPASDDNSVALQPFIRSRSPIAEIDQRLGIDESLGHGFADVSGGLDEPMAESPEPMRVQRKAASAMATAPTLAAPPPARAPAANLPASPSASPAALPSASSPAAPTPVATPAKAQPPAAELAPRREPMDPGPLFAPFALHYDEAVASESSSPTSTVELRTIEKVVERHATTLAPSSSPAPALAPSPAPVRSEAPLLTPSQSRAANVPWIAFDRTIPAIPEFPDFFHAPQPESKPASTRTELRVVPLAVEPRRPTPAPFVPEHEPAQEVAQTSSARAPTTPTQVRAANKAKPTPQTPSVPTPARGKLNIDSISQIGPLARHFPNRRHFRLRFR